LHIISSFSFKLVNFIMAKNNDMLEQERQVGMIKYGVY